MHHGGRAWALVMLKQAPPQSSIYTVDAVGSPLSDSGTFKLADTELNYMTSVATNPDRWGVMLVPRYNDGYYTGNLLRTDDSDRAYPIGSSIISNGGDMIKASLDAASYPSGSWDTSLETNSYCSGPQIWSNWNSAESYRLRWTSAGGCTYFDESVNGVGPGDVSCRIYAWAH